ncbi:MAG TPA: succinate dehydrogenase (quinone) flavoprotein subunit, partial [Gemmata sp.]|nr:succinate dehydrogenase (quinone) flavoprotein subunit [Gemmata sp.]
LERQVDAGQVKMYPRTEMLDVIVIDGRARGIVTRNLATGKIEVHLADAVLLCTGGYGTAYYLSTNAVNSNVTAAWRCHKRGSLFANPCFTQIHPTCIPVAGEHQSKLTLMSESLRNDGRVWVPKRREDVGKHPNEIPEEARDYYLERKYRSFGNLAPRDIASRAAKEACDDGRGVGPGGRGVYLDFADAIRKQGKERIEEKYGNLFEMYERITDEDAYSRPMRIYPAVHYTMGGLWVNYELMSNLPGLCVIGEANFSDHGANRLGASALMQGLADGYFVLPYTITNWLAEQPAGAAPLDHPEFKRVEAEAGEKLKKLLAIRGKKTAIELHRELGLVLWEHVGMTRSKPGLEKAMQRIRELRAEFWENVNVPGTDADLNVALERANRVADFMEFGELMALDALTREESCGGHFRVEHQTAEGEAKRDDEHFCHVAAWEYAGADKEPTRHIEPLEFEVVKLAVRSYR